MSTAPERAPAVPPLLYRLNTLPAALGVSIETIGRMRSKGTFPKPDLYMGSKMPCWKPETIRAWIDEQSQTRRGAKR